MTEDVRDQAAVLSSYTDAIVIRAQFQDRIEELASLATIPVINGMSEETHPCQILADLLTAGRIMGMESLYLKGGETQELGYRLGVRVGKIFHMLGFNHHEVKRNLRDAYRIRPAVATREVIR